MAGKHSKAQTLMEEKPGWLFVTSAGQADRRRRSMQEPGAILWVSWGLTAPEEYLNDGHHQLRII